MERRGRTEELAPIRDLLEVARKEAVRIGEPFLAFLISHAEVEANTLGETDRKPL